MSYRINNVSVVPPVGSVVSHTSNTIPSGWLLCNGATYNKSEYLALSNLLEGSYGNTSSGTTFVVPNFQAAFLRGAGTQTYPSGGTTYGYDTGTVIPRTINTAQGTALQTHNHNITHGHSVADLGHGHTVGDTNHSHLVTRSDSTFYLFWHVDTKGNYEEEGDELQFRGDVKFVAQQNGLTTSNATIGITNTGTSNISINSISNNTTNTNAYESIPFNYAINWIIKY